ncbi:hypothetical protein [Sulfuriroseicoccus oceanibius]|uniref:Tetratricopeptide repeat protein n=1 Tax=Sulfuriroseicoccus oceanibius TaxID=2707525 RepID=A0A6B3L960_9BACT|nr:hypothetical protein [Sulfuriroseicoccus oceanibius]QQL44299.1 hypothetical protein G3M56_010420 [Sulfuriroseicoccus oceanibius]
MRNPYSNPLHQEYKRRRKRVHLAVSTVVRFPLWLVWKVVDSVPTGLKRVVERAKVVLALPVNFVRGFARSWWESRDWKKMLVGSIGLAMIGGLASLWFMSGNLSDEERYLKYRGQAFDAMMQEDWESAGMLFSKLTSVEPYRSDKELLYQAMMVADRGGDMARRDELIQRLTLELPYYRAYAWLAQQMLAEGNRASTVREGIEYMNQALALAEKEELAEESDRLRLSLAELYAKDLRFWDLLELVDGMHEPHPRATLLKGRARLVLEYPTMAALEARKTIELLDNGALSDNPLEADVLRVGALMLLGDGAPELDAKLKMVQEVEQVLDAALLRNPGSAAVKIFAGRSYLDAARMLLRTQSWDGNQMGVGYLQLALDLGLSPDLVANAVYRASVLNPVGSVSLVDVREALVSGRGVMVAHVLLGLDAFKEKELERARFHFKRAKDHDEGAVDCLLNVAVVQSAVSEGGGIEGQVMMGAARSVGDLAMRLVEAVASVEGVDPVDVELTRCRVMLEQGAWTATAERLEPMLERGDEEQRATARQLLALAYWNDGKRDLAREIQQGGQ